MKPSSFTYHAPESVTEVLELLGQNQDEDVRVIAGGQSLVPLMNFRLSQPEILIDLGRVADLAQISLDDDVLTIGAMVRQSDAEKSPEVASFAPLMVEALGNVANPTVRNSGTVGGSLAHADPSAELPAVVRALQAQLVIQGPSGQRVVDADDFFDGPFTTVIEPDEILVAVRIPRRWQGQAFLEFARTHGSFALVGVGTCLDLKDGVVESASIALSGVGPTPLRASSAEQALVGADPTDDTIAAAAAADAAATSISPAADIHAGTAARVDITRAVVRRSIHKALSRALEGN
jgi:carbon-monoxide dehydrogenase medium subunit